jgi:hypothetical protein
MPYLKNQLFSPLFFLFFQEPHIYLSATTHNTSRNQLSSLFSLGNSRISFIRGMKINPNVFLPYKMEIGFFFVLSFPQKKELRKGGE